MSWVVRPVRGGNVELVSRRAAGGDRRLYRDAAEREIDFVPRPCAHWYNNSEHPPRVRRRAARRGHRPGLVVVARRRRALVVVEALREVAGHEGVVVALGREVEVALLVLADALPRRVAANSQPREEVALLRLGLEERLAVVGPDVRRELALELGAGLSWTVGIS